MNSREAIDLWGHVFSYLQHGIWYLVGDAEEEFHPTACMVISLSVYLYKLLLIESGIMFRHGDNLSFSLRKLDEIKVHVQENLDIRYSRIFCKQEVKPDFLFV
jgi:hypothetical protein